jgi:hypothetical protein
MLKAMFRRALTFKHITGDYLIELLGDYVVALMELVYEIDICVRGIHFTATMATI